MEIEYFIFLPTNRTNQSCIAVEKISQLIYSHHVLKILE